MSKKVDVKLSPKKQVELDISCKSLIGKEIEIIDSNNKNQIRIKGLLVFESANLFYVKVGSEILKILKKGTVIEVALKNDKAMVNSEIFSGNLVSRIKKIK